MKILRLCFTILTLLCLALGLSTCSEPEKPTPSVTSVSPEQGTIGTPVTITGKNLATALSVSFGDVSLPIANKTDTKIETVVPPGLAPGTLSVSVKADHATSNGISFLVLPSEPEITSINPSKASVGMQVTLVGKNFNTASSVSFGTKSMATFISKNDTEIKLAVPDGLSLGALDVTVTTAGGTSEKTAFTVVGKPTISSFTPAIGPVGKIVQINGTFFEDPAQVKFGAGVVTTFEIKNATLIEATVPASATTGKVTVTTPGGEAISSVDYVVKDAPTITSFTPASDIVGAVVTINGTSFDGGALVVKFGAGTAASPTLVSPTKITAIVPASATSGKITVETAAGSAQSATDFTVIGSPSVTAFSPTSGQVGVEVTVTGTNFVTVENVKINTTTILSPNFTVVSPTQIKVNVPAGAATGKISVKTPVGTGISANNFIVLAPPTITSFSPGSGAQGSTVVITGTGFSSITSVSFNDVNAPNFTVNSSTQITVTVPANATNGKIKATNSLGTATSVNTFYVTPFISTISPTSGNAGSTLTITGTNLGAAKVRFNSTEVTPLTNTNTNITVIVPSIGAGAVNVTVVNLGGTSNSKTFTVSSPVVLNEIVATANITEQLILLKGNNLLGATKVMFGTVEGDVYTNTSTVVTSIIPASLAVGNYSVTVVTPNGTSNGKAFERLSVQNPNTGDVNMVNGATVVAPPGGYVPPVSNQWTNTFDPSQRFLLLDNGSGATGTFDIEFSIDFNLVATGTGIYDKTNNYIEFTLAGIRYVGIWTPRNSFNDGFDDFCVYHMTLISAESGKQLELSVNVFGPCE